MKKLAVLAAIATVASVNAAETKMKVTGRFDYQNTETETTSSTGTTSKDSSGEYKATYLRWKNTAKFNDTTSVELTLNFAETADGVRANNTLTNFVDNAFLTKSLGNGFSAMIGKQAVLIGGRENDWSSADMYGKSKFNSDTPSNLIGLSAAYEVAGQTFYVQHLEGENDSNTLTDKKVTGVAWYGDLMGGMVKPIASYHKVGTNNSGSYDLLTTFGAQVNWNALTFEADYLMRTNEKTGTNAAGTSTDAELNSMVFHARYAFDMYRPFAKYIMEETEGSYDLSNISNEVEAERNVMELGLEIVPNKDEDMRYHIVYSAAETEETKRLNSASSERNEKFEETKIFAGVKFGLNL